MTWTINAQLGSDGLFYPKDPNLPMDMVEVEDEEEVEEEFNF